MALSPTAAVAGGLDRLSRRRLVLPAVVLFGVHLLVSVASQSQLAIQREEFADDPLFADGVVPETLPLALEVPLGVASLGVLAGSVAFVTASSVAFRALLARERTGDDDLDLASLVLLTVHGVAAAIVGVVAVAIGLVAFFVPGLVVATVLAFTHPYVTVDGDSALEAMGESIEATAGDRLQVFAVLAASVGAYLGVSLAGGFVYVILESVAPLLGELANVAVATVAWLVVLAILADAFEQVEDARTERAERFAGIDEELLP